MIIICCKSVIVDVNSKNPTLSEILSSCTFNDKVKTFVVQEKKTQDKIIIIAVNNIVLNNIICQCNVFLFSPTIVFNDGYIIDLSNNTKANDRPQRRIDGMYGLAGLPGPHGYNLLLVANDVKCHDNFGNFFSKGGTGGTGQEGQPGGEGGIGGIGGKLITNRTRTVVKVGEPGNHGVSKGNSKAGLMEPEENNEGINLPLPSFINYVRGSTFDLKIDEEGKIFDLLY
jgi:hypothetical protein